MAQNFVSTLTQLRKKTPQLSTYRQTLLSCASVYKWERCGSAKVQMFSLYVRIKRASGSRSPWSCTLHLHSTPLQVGCTGFTGLYLFCSARGKTLGCASTMAACGVLFAICIYLPKSSQSVLQLFSSNHCGLWHLISNTLSNIPTLINTNSESSLCCNEDFWHHLKVHIIMPVLRTGTV